MSAEFMNDDFEVWLFDMDDELETFIRDTSPQVKCELDFSEESLDAIEAWLLSKYRTPDEILHDSQKHILDRTARYVGETIRKKYRLIWKIELQKPDDVYFGLPVMTDEKRKRNYVCPHSLVTATIDRQEKGYMGMVFQAVML